MYTGDRWFLRDRNDGGCLEGDEDHVLFQEKIEDVGEHLCQAFCTGPESTAWNNLWLWSFVRVGPFERPT